MIDVTLPCEFEDGSPVKFERMWEHGYDGRPAARFNTSNPVIGHTSTTFVNNLWYHLDDGRIGLHDTPENIDRLYKRIRNVDQGPEEIEAWRL